MPSVIFLTNKQSLNAREALRQTGSDITNVWSTGIFSGRRLDAEVCLDRNTLSFSVTDSAFQSTPVALELSGTQDDHLTDV